MFLVENVSIVIQIYNKKMDFGLYFENKSLFLVCFLTKIWSVFGLFFWVFGLGKELAAVELSILGIGTSKWDPNFTLLSTKLTMVIIDETRFGVGS